MTPRLALAVALMSVCFGCGPADHSFPALHPVSGVVQLGAKPAVGGLVQLQAPALGEAMLLVQGPVNDKGEFELSTTSAKIKKKLPGAPAGLYKIIYLPTGSDQQVMPIEAPGSQTVETKENRWAIKLRP